jgi:hypothetical protein
MIDKITESEWACYWACFIGNKEIMLPKAAEFYYKGNGWY